VELVTGGDREVREFGGLGIWEEFGGGLRNSKDNVKKC
jgi:hypothetical protein